MENEQWEFYAPTKIYFGSGQFQNLPEIVKELYPKKIMLVTGKHSMKKLGFTDAVRNMLSDYSLFIYDKIEPNPTDLSVDEGAAIAKEKKIDLVIALGGGSAIDAAKGIAMLATNSGKILDYLHGRREIENKTLPLIAITTTAGTSSEMNRYSVITDTEKNSKMAIRSYLLNPKAAIIDPKLTLSMPPYVTACSGLDALCHAVDALVDTRAFPLSKYFAQKAIELIYKNLLGAINHGDNLEYRTGMSLAQLYAGYSFLNTGTNATHAFAHPFTENFSIAHGHACSLTVIEFLKLLKGKRDSDLEMVAQAVGAKTTDKAIEKLEDLRNSTGLKFRLSELGIGESDIDKIVDSALPSRNMKTYPLKLTPEQARALVSRLF